MIISQLLTKLEELNIHINVVDEKLKIQAPEGKLTPALINELKEKKQEIIDFFQKKVQKQNYISIAPVEEKEYYALSSAQKRMYFLQQLDLKSTVYNILRVIPLPGHFDLKKLETTFKKLIDRHESLRTSFEIADDRPIQKIHREVDFSIHDYNSIDDFICSFNLSKAPLLRVGIIGLENKGHTLAVDMHHIISDGFSHQILTREFMSLYNNEILTPLRVQYKDYAEWQNSDVHREANKKQEAYWFKIFSGEIPSLDLPMDYPRPSFQSFEGSNVFFEIPAKETALLKEMVLKKDITLYMILLSLLNILMSKLSGQEDIVIGTPNAGRRHADLENIIGMFVNTLAMRNYPSGEKTFEYFLFEVGQQVLEAFENQDYQFEDLVEKVALKREAVRNPLFDVMFALQNLGENLGHGTALVRADVGKTNNNEYKSSVSRFDMSWAAMEIGNYLVFNVEYSTKLFNETTIYKFFNYFKRIITAVIENPRIRISAIEIMSEEERKEILLDFNNANTPYPKDKTLHQLFEEQAKHIPDHIAVIMYTPGDEIPHRKERRAVTYNELNNKADALVNILKQRGIKPGLISALMIERSIEMIAAMLAILKSGGTYLPLDPKSPEERVRYMLEDSTAAFILTHKEYLNKFQILNGKFSDNIIDIKKIYFDHKERFDSKVNMPGNQKILYPNQLVYIMYTSGSTGKPKGVMIEHRNVVRLVQNTNFIQWSQGDRLLPTGAGIFDISTFEIWGPLLNDTVIVLVEEKEILDPGKLTEIIRENRITILHLVPQLFSQLVHQTYDMFAELKYFLIGGDLVSTNQIIALIRRYRELKIVHMYGPTENTTFSTYLPVNEFYRTTIPIGKPIANSMVYIVDKYENLVPISVSGELIVGGDGIARGYLNRPELTAEKFIQFHHSSFNNYHSKLYKTGDLCRWLPHGNIEFQGRIDSQVKIRGQRIELGEIENQILAYESIKEVVVLPFEKNEDKLLGAYFVPFKEFEIASLREYLNQKLPEYMVPSYFIPIEAFPLTPTGKINKKALPIPEVKASEKYIPPRDKREEMLCKIWSEVLGIEKEKIGIDDNFFEIGGNSLNLIMLVGKIYKELGIEIPIPQIYRYPTIRDITRDMISMHYSEQFVILLNRERPKKIFCFPDQLGWGYGYGSMAALLGDYSVYALSFIEDESRKSKYIDLIKNIQPHGPYVFFGHSAAGRLLFEIAKALENQGCQVSDIIFADCFILEFDVNGEEERRMHTRFMVEEFLERWNAGFLADIVYKKAINHMMYLQNELHLEIINSNIHMILSEESQQRHEDPLCWKKWTTKNYHIYNGWGRHVAMLGGSDLDKNIEIIRNILNKINY